MLETRLRRPTHFKVCDQTPLPRLQQRPINIERVTESLLKRNKYLYLDMKESKGDGFRLLSPEQHLSSDSEEEVQVLNSNICITNLKKLCKGTVQMHSYLRRVRKDQEQQKKLKETLKQYSSSKRIKTEPAISFELPELSHLKAFTTKQSTKDIREFLVMKNHQRLEERTRSKEKDLLNHHRKLSSFARLVRRRKNTTIKREDNSTQLTKTDHRRTKDIDDRDYARAHHARSSEADPHKHEIPRFTCRVAITTEKLHPKH